MSKEIRELKQEVELLELEVRKYIALCQKDKYTKMYARIKEQNEIIRNKPKHEAEQQLTPEMLDKIRKMLADRKKGENKEQLQHIGPSVEE